MSGGNGDPKQDDTDKDTDNGQPVESGSAKTDDAGASNNEDDGA